MIVAELKNRLAQISERYSGFVNLLEAGRVKAVGQNSLMAFDVDGAAALRQLSIDIPNQLRNAHALITSEIALKTRDYAFGINTSQSAILDLGAFQSDMATSTAGGVLNVAGRDLSFARSIVGVELLTSKKTKSLFGKNNITDSIGRRASSQRAVEYFVASQWLTLWNASMLNILLNAGERSVIVNENVFDIFDIDITSSMFHPNSWALILPINGSK